MAYTSVFLSDSSPHVKVTAAGLWADIVEEVGWYYHYKLK